MSNRRTLLLITQTRLARIDTIGGKSPRAKSVWTRERLPGESMATLADAAIRLGPKTSGDVWVFANEIWTGVVHLAADVAGALEGEELDQAIALEAETFSGVSAFDSRLGLKALPKDDGGEARWWVTQVPQSDWQEVDQAIQQFRSKLAGMGHSALSTFPGNADAGIKSLGESQSWTLNQAFGEATISINGVGENVRDVITLGDLQTQRTQTQLMEWCDAATAEQQPLAWVSDHRLPEAIVDPDCPQLLLTASPSRDEHQGSAEDSSELITGETALRAWAETMTASIQSCEGADATMPLAVARKPPMSNQTATLIACALGLLFALGCFAIHSSTSNQLAKLDSQIDTFNRTKKALAAEKQSLQNLKKEVTKKQESLAEIRALNEDLAGNLNQAVRIRKLQQTRWLKLVSALSKASESECWVRGLESHGNVVTVQGMAVSNRDISVFATNLEKYASPHGWRVHPAQTERNEMALVEFEVSLDVSDRVTPNSKANPPTDGSSSSKPWFAGPIQTAQTEIGK